MKKLIKLILITFLLLTQYSCEDWLEILPPSGLYREEFWKEKEDVKAVLMSAYSKTSTLDRALFLHGELRADLIVGTNRISGNERNIMQSNIYPDNPYCNWGDFYSAINYCNEVIKNAPKVKEIDETYTDFRMRSDVSEAQFLRSLIYFYLVRIYKDVPLITEPTETDNADFFLTKSSEEVILNRIVSDLKSNREFAPSGGFPTLAENKGRASKSAFDALLADIELWRFNYEEVLLHVQKIEDSEKFELVPRERWFEIFYPGNSLESIFEMQYDASLGQWNGTAGLSSRFNPQYIPSETALQLFTVTSNTTVTEIQRGENASIAKYGEDNYGIWKYIGQSADGRNTTRSGLEYSSGNFIIYRLADVLLMKAEALSQLDRFDEALQIINTIELRAGVPTSGLANSRKVFEDDILDQRARELAFEGKRWFDLMRLGRRNNYERKNDLIEIIIANVPSTQKRILSTKLRNPLGWYLPVYKNELESNFKMQQNPYYDN